MKIIFLSNFFDHHQKPFSETVSRMQNVEYTFVALSRMTQERISLGYDNKDVPSYVLEVDLNNNDAKNDLINKVMEADIVIKGSAPDYLIKKRTPQNGLTFIYTERIFKKGIQPLEFLASVYKHIRYRNIYNNCYFLTASAYTPFDFRLTGCVRNKMFKWGYYPPFIKQEVKELIDKKINKSILWVGRFIDWKHPEIPIKIAARLRDDGYQFHISMIGTGKMIEKIRSSVRMNNLTEYISILGAMSPDAVRRHMENSEIFLFTSDRNEGWGAVLNEALNSGCAVVANKNIGAVPYLLVDGHNGFIYNNDDLDMLYFQIITLLKDENYRKKLSVEAYNTIAYSWNADVATQRFVKLCESLLQGRTISFSEGPCSKASFLIG